MALMTEELLRKACGAVRAATEADAVDGVAPSYVAAPASVAETAELMRATAGLRVVARGGGSKLGWGAPPAAFDVVVDTTGLAEIVEYNPGDQVISAQAGVRLAALQDRVAAEGQLLGLDPPEPGATLGGVIAANASGPRRLRYGSARELLIGVTAVLADGTVAQAGGKVVKNVAGYDLMKLYCGSLGTLGIITDTTWRLHPRPPARRVVTAAAYERDAVKRLLHSTLTPTAAEVMDDRLVILFEAIEPSVQAQAAEAVELLGGGAEVGADLPSGFGDRPWAAGGIGLTVAYETAALPEVLDAVRSLGEVTLRGRAAVGVLDVGVPVLDVAGLTRLRAAVAPYDGTVVVRSMPPEQKAELDVWGPAGDALPLMRRVKERFDPQGRLAPGRFVGGI